MIRPLILETLRAALLRASGGMFLGLSVLLGADAALAAPACASHEALSKQLEQRYAEVPIAMGLASSGKVIQVFASADGASWTVVLTHPDGTSCIAAAGRYWQTVTAKALGPEA